MRKLLITVFGVLLLAGCAVKKPEDDFSAGRNSPPDCSPSHDHIIICDWDVPDA